MAKQLWFLRHGEAEPHGERPDADRRLTTRGEQQAHAAGAALSRLGLSFDLLATSPRIRALDTARLAAQELNAEIVEDAALDKGFDSSAARAVMKGLPEDGIALVVGHEPDFSGTVEALTGARVDVKKGGVVALREDGRTAELIAVLRPRDLALMAGRHR